MKPRWGKSTVVGCNEPVVKHGPARGARNRAAPNRVWLNLCEIAGGSLAKGFESMQTCGVHCDFSAIARSLFARRKPRYPSTEGLFELIVQHRVVMNPTGLHALSLDWQLSPALRRSSHDEATTAALKELMARIKSAASTLGLQVDHVQQVTLGGPAYQPGPPYSVMAIAATAMPASLATSAPEEVTAEVSADYVLKP
jgi:hypothetical protein